MLKCTYFSLLLRVGDEKMLIEWKRCEKAIKDESVGKELLVFYRLVGFQIQVEELLAFCWIINKEEIAKCERWKKKKKRDFSHQLLLSKNVYIRNRIQNGFGNWISWYYKIPPPSFTQFPHWISGVNNEKRKKVNKKRESNPKCPSNWKHILYTFERGLRALVNYTLILFCFFH